MPSLSSQRLALYLLLLVGMTSVGRAEVLMEARIGFDRNYRPGLWTPVYVTLSNQDAADGRPATDIEGKVRLTVEDVRGNAFQIERTVDLPANSQKGLTLYAKFAENERATRLQLIRGNGTEAAGLMLTGDNSPTATRLVPLDAGGDPLVLVVQPPAAGQDVVLPRGEILRTIERRIPAAAFPDRWAGLQGVDLVIIGGWSTGMMSDEQLSALRKYVSTGGRLVLVGGTASLGIGEAPIKDLLPADILGATEYQAILGTRGAEAVLLTDVRLKDGAIVLRHATLADGGEHPLAIYREFGLGEVYLWTFDGAFRGDLIPILLTALRHNRVEMFERGWRHALRPALTPDALLADAGQPPNIILIVLLLAAYYLAVGPINFRYLYRRQKLEWAWVTIPAIVLVFSLGIYVVGILTMGRDTLQLEFALVQAEVGQSDAREIAYSALFSPKMDDRFVRPTGSLEALVSDGAGTTWTNAGLSGISGPLERQAFEMRLAQTARNLTSQATSSLGGLGGSAAPVRIGQDFPLMELPDLPTPQWVWTVVEATGPARLADATGGPGLVGSVTHRGSRLSGSLTNASPNRILNAEVRITLAEEIPSDQMPGRRVVYPLGDLEPGESFDFDGIVPAVSSEPPFANRPAAQADARSRFLKEVGNMLLIQEGLLEFPRGKAMLYGELERPNHQAVKFDGRGIAVTSLALLVAEIPLVPAPARTTSLPSNGIAIYPTLIKTEPGSLEPSLNESGQLGVESSEIVFHAESPFAPGAANAIDARLMPLMLHSGPVGFDYSLEYYDFRLTRWAVIASSSAAGGAIQPEGFFPAGSPVGVLRLRTRRSGPASSNPMAMRSGNMAAIDIPATSAEFTRAAGSAAGGN